MVNIIEIIAPARCDFSMTSDQIREVVENMGFEANIPDDIAEKGADLLCCNSLEQRRKLLIDALTNKQSKIIWALAGGYGTTELLTFLDQIDFSENEKIIVGFSDITALMIYFIQKYKWKCLHARNIRGIIQGKSNTKELELLKSCLREGYAKLKYDILPFNKRASQESEMKAETTGGNMALLQCSLGTNWEIIAKDKILLLEDVDEPGYRMDRMLVHLNQAGVFEHVKAVILGDFACGKENDLVKKVLKRFFENKNFPVFKTDQFGHGKKNKPFPLGVKAHLFCGTQGKILFDNKLLNS